MIFWDPNDDNFQIIFERFVPFLAKVCMIMFGKGLRKHRQGNVEHISDQIGLKLLIKIAIYHEGSPI